MRNLWILGSLLLFTSCQLFSSKEEKTQKIVEQEMKGINWNDVDQYPLFEECDETASKTDQKYCFENTLLSHLKEVLNQFEFILDQSVDTTVYVDFLVDNKGNIEVLEIEKDEKIDAQMPEFDGLISQSLKSIPHVEPAIKRGIPVTTKFRMPIKLNTKQP